ncbi:MAG TPA: D-hexose-6-phosphate mutarotase [Tepidisphaeraceae bacterium]|jgi:glucose-6-phosphate 1-epimerase|nr:D-hexose-6-phosphate mutarotase [Tepidisphaeraceae bacterium]
MNDIQELKRRFKVRGVSVDTGQGGLTRVVVETPDAEAQVYLHGAHVTRYQPRGGHDLLFMSTKSVFAPGKAIRGGVPIIFPWFGARANDPAAPMHGFARTSEWDLADVRKGTHGSIALVLELNSTDATRKIWPHDFRLRYTVTIDHSLDLLLEVNNTSETDFTVEEALHTYLAVADVREVSIEGLAGREFLDKTDGMRRKTQPAGAITITGETDRVYLNTTDAVSVHDPGLGRKLFVEKSGSSATVLWNPWTAKAKAMADFGKDEWPGMLCVETANAAENFVTVPAGKKVQMKARLHAGAATESRTATKQWEMTGLH